MNTFPILSAFVCIRYKSRVWLWGPSCAHGVLSTPHREVRDNLDEELANLHEMQMVELEI